MRDKIGYRGAKKETDHGYTPEDVLRASTRLYEGGGTIFRCGGNSTVKLQQLDEYVWLRSR